MLNHTTQLHDNDNTEQDHSKRKTKNLIFITQIITVLIAILIMLCWMGEDQLSDQLKSEAVISNAVHVAKLDAAERRRESIAMAALGSAGNTGADKP